MSNAPRIRSTTILAVRRDGRVALGGDGQVSIGETVMKANAQKVRTLKGGKVLAGFAGSTADAFTLFERFEEKLERFPENLPRAAVMPSPGAAHGRGVRGGSGRRGAPPSRARR